MSDKPKLTDGELISRLQIWEQHGKNASKAARAIGISASSYRSSVRDATARGLTATTKIVDNEAKLRTKLKLVEQELAAVQKHNESAESIRKEIYNLSEMTADPPKWLTAKPKKHQNANVPVVIWSDWHFGEVVSREQMGGSNEFSTPIGKRRVRTLVEKTIEIAKHHMVKPKYKGIVVCIGGDMITGAIHEELGATNDRTVLQSCLDVQESLIWALSKIADEFGRVFVPCVIGNHPRTTHKPRMKNAVWENYEWNVYCQLERHFRKDKRIQFAIPAEPDCLFAVNGHRFLLSHGDRLGVRGGDGIIGCLGPIARGAMKVWRSEAQIGRDFETLILAHWHTYIPRSRACAVMVNGTLKGYDEYARLGLRTGNSPPSQALFFVNQKYGIVCQWELILEAEQTSLKGKRTDWVTWQGKAQYVH